MAAFSFLAGVKERNVRVFISETSRFGRPSSPQESGVHTEVKKTLLFFLKPFKIWTSVLALPPTFPPHHFISTKFDFNFFCSVAYENKMPSACL